MRQHRVRNNGVFGCTHFLMIGSLVINPKHLHEFSVTRNYKNGMWTILEENILLRGSSIHHDCGNHSHKSVDQKRKKKSMSRHSTVDDIESYIFGFWSLAIKRKCVNDSSLADFDEFESNYGLTFTHIHSLLLSIWESTMELASERKTSWLGLQLQHMELFV